MDHPQQVVDETGAVHVLTQRIGVGGQGQVWLVSGGRRIVKLLDPGRDAEEMRQRFKAVRRLDLRGLDVARPLAVLRPPHVGYVAEFLGDMAPIKTLREAPRSDLVQWHIDTGGLRRRLRLLAHAGEVLRDLHARGITYADVSDRNVFVSAPVHANEAWLIDLDNLSNESSLRNAIYTPGYGAPEVVARNSGNMPHTDAWSFGVLVWQVLTLGHPFVGDVVNDGDPDLEQQAFAGGLSWVRHSTDDSNRCSTGLPPEGVLGAKLLEVARQAFEAGLRDRAVRPSVSKWVERLHIAADQTVLCTSCRGTFFVTAESCPWCSAPRPEVLPVRIKRWQPEHELMSNMQPLLRGGISPADALHHGRKMMAGMRPLLQLPLTVEGLKLPCRITLPDRGAGERDGHSARDVHIEIKLVDRNRGISVRAMPGFEAWVAPVRQDGAKPESVTGRGRIVPATGWMLFFDEPGRAQRVALLGGDS